MLKNNWKTNLRNRECENNLEHALELVLIPE